MADKHSQSFFGQSTGFTIQSSSKNEPFIFLKFIKKKKDDTWEKFSQGEGKTIKISLEEMIMIFQVLKHKINSWNSYHTYKEDNTPISFSWESNKENILWINIGTYSKMLGFAQIEIFRLFLKHLIKEKIKFATLLNSSQKQDINPGEKQESSITNDDKNDLILNPNIMTNSKKVNDTNDDQIIIDGFIKTETEKALLIVFNSGQEAWFPKSAIHSQYKREIGIEQKFLTSKWIIEKNKILI
ncbi:MAG: hypothetical protein EU535_04785 [Promethearchaeota archaeon]|nr:MAG: hypothetical protein EU535_04785 [Candidatus Lokiarchaeota archaeon]